MTNSIHEVYAYLCVNDVEEAIDFYTRAFGAREHFRLTDDNGKVGHAEVYFGETIVMLAEAFPEMGIVPPDPEGPTNLSIHLHVDNADSMYASALEAGGKGEREPEDQFYGERSAALRDPFGYRWLLGHSIEDVSINEMQSRYDNVDE